MALQLTERHSRRSLLTGAVGAVAGAVAATLAGARAVLAAGDDGKVIHVGDIYNNAQSTTSLSNPTDAHEVLHLSNNGGGRALWAQTLGYGDAVRADASRPGVAAVRGCGYSAGEAGVNAAGIAGFSGPTFDETVPKNVGVYGKAYGVDAVGVHGVGDVGGVFSGDVAQLRLIPTSETSHPDWGTLGDLFLDRSGGLWFCKGGTTWVQLA